MSDAIQVGDQIGVSKVRVMGGETKSTYVRIPVDFVKMYSVKSGQKASLFRSADGKETVIRIADEVESASQE